MGKGYRSAVSELGRWFDRQKRVLPWRDRPTLYRVWISEIMLQQTQVATVVPYFERFVERFPDVNSLAEAPVEDVLALWAGLGYYSRARNLHKGARHIVERGGFPRERGEWLAVPGVGEYTAVAILSIALDRPEALLDGNVERVFSRLRAIRQEKTKAKKRMWRLARAAVRTAREEGVPPRAFNQALMELGAMVCTPKKPKCPLCPVSEACRARRTGEPEAFPVKTKRAQWKKVDEELHCWSDGGGRLLLHKRAPGEWRAGLWDFGAEAPPGGKYRKLGTVENRYVVTRHKVTRRTHIWVPRAKPAWSAAEPAPGNTEAAWVAPDEVATGSPFKKTLQAIRARYSLDLDSE